MMGVSLLALAANVTSLWLVARHREGGVHMKATYICTANDVLANLGVIAAGALVAGTGSRLPDLVIGGADRRDRAAGRAADPAPALTRPVAPARVRSTAHRQGSMHQFKI